MFLLLVSIVVNAQFNDDMESYIEGEPIYEGWWTDWGCQGNCSLVSTSTQSHSGLLSGYIGGSNGNSNRMPILNLSNKISGEWGLSFWMFIPSNKEGYFHLQGVVPIGSGEWIVGNIFFNHDLDTPGIGEIDYTALGSVLFDFPHEQWFQVVMNVDLTGGISQGTWEFRVDENVVIPTGTPFTDFDGNIPTSLGGISFFTISEDNELYMDDFNYIEGTILKVGESKNLSFSMFPNPAQNILNIQSQEQIEVIKIYSLQGNFLKEGTASRIDISQLNPGMYFVQVTIDGKSTTKKFIKY